jgi:hypothetical protein
LYVILQICRPASIDQVLLKDVVNFLRVFLDALQEFEGDHHTTVQLALPWFLKIGQHCTPVVSDSKIINALKENAATLFKTKFLLSSEHYLATMLNPKMKGLKVI